MNEQFFKDLDGLIRIPSVAIDGDEKYPFGKECDNALDYMLSLCDSFGFRTKKCGNLIGYAEIGEGEEIVGILAHLDVVPEGNGWDYPAFKLSRAVIDGKDSIIGRGVSDDKGPALICVYAMKKLLDEGIHLRRRIRIIFGITEERGEWLDMQHYCKTEQLPYVGFTPDASFPACYGEKGIAHLDLIMPKSVAGIDFIDGGSAANMVPDRCSCTVNQKEFFGEGISAHGSVPHIGKNAIIDCMEKINKLSPCHLSDFVVRCFDERCGGELMGCACCDSASGKLSLNLGVAKMCGDDVVLTIDIRYPVTLDFAPIEKAITEKCADFKVKAVLLENKAPVYFDKNGVLISTLCKIYKEHSRDNTEPYVMGGGTYSRAMPNIVAFGPNFPSSPETAHQKNENVPVDEIDTAYKIYADALVKLCEIKM